jgi:hypothetical protein
MNSSDWDQWNRYAILTAQEQNVRYAAFVAPYQPREKENKK